MLVLSRKPNQSIVIDGQITVTLMEIRGNRVQLGIEAPREIPVMRTELTIAMDDGVPALT
jgi:carbon storage regulator